MIIVALVVFIVMVLAGRRFMNDVVDFVLGFLRFLAHVARWTVRKALRA